jgi:hypothetical protein
MRLDLCDFVRLKTPRMPHIKSLKNLEEKKAREWALRVLRGFYVRGPGSECDYGVPSLPELLIAFAGMLRQPDFVANQALFKRKMKRKTLYGPADSKKRRTSSPGKNTISSSPAEVRVFAHLEHSSTGLECPRHFWI